MKFCHHHASARNSICTFHFCVHLTSESATRAFAREDHPTISFLFGLEYEVVRMWIYSALGIVLTNCHFGHMITFWPHIWVILCSFTNSILYGSILLWLQVGPFHWIAGSLCTPSVLKWYVYFDQGKVIQSRFWPLIFFSQYVVIC
jgi:hypothetical protein